MDIKPRRIRINAATVVLLLVVGIGALLYFILSAVDRNLAYEAPESAPDLDISVLISGLNHPWDVVESPDGVLVFTERGKGISRLKDGQSALLERPSDLVSRGEGGMMGLVLDPDFSKNRFLYACYMSPDDVRLIRWQVSDDWSSLGSRLEIITGMPRNSSGRHSGCRPLFGPDGFLWLGTGDAAEAANPQDPKSLGGKILRVSRDGSPAPGNMGEPFDPRIYSYGHRNTQGLAFLSEPIGDITGYSVEHGPATDDEINPLLRGNFGWDPLPSYNENVPMTDLEKFPDAISSAWSSGSPTIAPSGMTFIRGEEWGEWDGYLALAVLKDRHILLFEVMDSSDLRDQALILTDHGRLRSVMLTKDGNLLVTTDNGGDQDQILLVTPR